MTVEEALERIHRAGRCFVIFDASRGEVLEIHSAGAETTPAALIGTMRTASNLGSVKGRFFDGATVTREMLEHEVEESHRVANRIAAFSRWAVLPPDELVHLLETDDFGPPMDTSHGPHVVIATLFDYPPDVLGPLVPRLERVAHGGRQLEESVQRFLESKLAVLAGDFSRLKAAWERFDPRAFSGVVWHPELLESLGDLRPSVPEAIEILIHTVSYPALMFGPRCEAMRSLGKVGAPAGPKAAEGIRNKIYDSEPWVVELRERVLLRIETPLDEWVQCPRCYWGKIPGRPRDAHGYCDACLGLAVVRRH